MVSSKMLARRGLKTAIGAKKKVLRSQQPEEIAQHFQQPLAPVLARARASFHRGARSLI
jgi:hypothetical protein